MIRNKTKLVHILNKLGFKHTLHLKAAIRDQEMLFLNI